MIIQYTVVFVMGYPFVIHQSTIFFFEWFPLVILTHLSVSGQRDLAYISRLRKRKKKNSRMINDDLPTEAAVYCCWLGKPETAERDNLF